ncbi:molybdopterin-dependent oxidoreductase [Edaphobacter albus]|uniref:molybdopterin-dependent oxidoreductase n=1 Tax=Edaphobacter sp. 4G125 TaxID=2763071 RepID=UPI001645A78E|nr:molybdopterin-dependent oxidoreductase [Edaphobacter sp. 4G125]QNI35395.1 molybdopterin-dependent oxidoreductase [Edaphobacter sp. 4G125]
MRISRFAVILALVLSPTNNFLYSQTPAGHEHKKAIPSTELQLTIDGKTTTVTQAELAVLPQKSVTVHNPHTQKDETYTGAALGDLLAKHGFAVGQATHRTMLRSYITAEGTDKYWVLYSVTEIEPSEHSADVIIATSMNGQPLGEDGQLKLVASADKKPQRWVRNLAAIRLVTVAE